MRLSLAVICLLAALSPHAFGQVQTFPNNYAGFLQAAGHVSTIDFETLPDGTPSDGHQGTLITESYNYDLQGAHFSAPIHYPYLAGGGGAAGIDLRALELQPAVPTWLTADLTAPARAVGVFFPGGTTLFAYDAAGSLIGSVTYTSSGSHFFIGLVSNSRPVSRVVINRGTNGEDIESFVFTPVPEPCTVLLTALGLSCAMRRGRFLRMRAA